MIYGTYEKRMRNSFLVIGFCFLLIMGGLSSYFGITTIKNNTQEAWQQTTLAKNDILKVSLSVIMGSVLNIQESGYAKNWASSGSQEDYYYYSVKLFKEISKSSTNLSGIKYSIALTFKEDDSFVVTGLGTTKKEAFFTESPGLDWDTWYKVTSIMGKSNINSNYLLPHYVEGKLEYLYYFIQEKGSLHTVYYIVTIPASTLLGTERDMFMFNKQKILAYGLESEADRKRFDSIYSKIVDENDYNYLTFKTFEYNRESIFLVQPGILNWGFAFPRHYSTRMFVISGIGLLIPLLLLGSILLLVLMKVSKRLYEPIRETVTRLPKPETEKFDEFALLDQNLGTLDTMNIQLQQAMEENKSLAKQRYYRDLIYGIPTTISCPLSDTEQKEAYAVAIVEIFSSDIESDTNDWYLQLQKNLCNIYIQKLRPEKTVYFVNISHDSFVIVMNAANRGESVQLVSGLFDIPNLTARLLVCLSENRQTIKSIAESYKEAQRVAEFRYMANGNRILTLEDLSVIRGDSFYYPLITENRIVQSLALGKKDALELYDEVIRDNFEEAKLSPAARRNLIYALIGTLLRTTQELKTDLKDGEIFDFPWLYNHWDSPDITKHLRGNFEKVLALVSDMKEYSDSLLLKKMMEFIYNNFQDDIMLVDISQYCNITPNYCSTLFKKLTSENFKTFLNNYRIDMAMQMIEKDPTRKISDISNSVGFNSSNSFIRVFDKKMGITPGLYAEQVQLRKTT
jgi:YesN/AraC family two-component response regulator